MTSKEGVLKSIRFIESNLREDINVFQISREIGYSLYHFIRLFQSITGYSPKNYLQQRRLSEAALDLQNSKKKVVDIAYDYQFGSPESFTRAFQRQFKISPSELRKGFSTIKLPLLKSLNAYSINQKAKLHKEEPTLLELEERLLIGASFFVRDDHELNDLSREWMLFMHEVPTIEHLVKPEHFYQVQYWSNNQDLNGMYFFTGVEVSRPSSSNSFFVMKIIPQGKYLRFIHRGFANQVPITYQFIYNEYLPHTEYKLNKPFNFEYYGEKCTGPFDENSESEIYIPIG